MKNTPFHLLQWQYDLLGGQEIETIIRGNLDGAVLTAQGGQLIIPEASGGGRVHHFRGAWLTTVEFTWDGYWALPKGSPTNYFTGGSAVNSGNQTIVTLGTDPGDGMQLQVYYYFGSGQTFAPKTPIEAYPAFIPCRQGTKQKFSSAPDADQWIALAMLEARARWDDFKRCYGWSIIESLKAFAGSGDQAIIDDFNRDPSRVRDEGHWTFSGSDPASTITPSITDEGTLRIDSNIAEGGFGYFGWGRPIDIPPDCSKILALFKGQGYGKALQLAINTDPSAAYDLDKIFYYGVVDRSTEWRQLEASFGQFIKINHMIWDGDRIDWDIWGVTPEERYYEGDLVGATFGELSRHQAEWIEDGFNHGQCLRVDMRHINTRYANGTRMHISTTPTIDTRTVAGISFGVRWIFDPFGVHELRVEIVDGQYSPRWEFGGASAYWRIDGSELTYWKRINLKWTDLIWLGKSIPNIYPFT